HARPVQGDRPDPRPAAARLPGLVRDADVPPVPAAPPDAEAPRRRRLDDLAVLPPRHRGAGNAGPSRAAHPFRVGHPALYVAMGTADANPYAADSPRGHSTARHSAWHRRGPTGWAAARLRPPDGHVWRLG